MERKSAIDMESVITHLQIIHTWASFARERDLQFFTEKHLEDIAQWSDDALNLLKEQEAVIPILDTSTRGIEVKCGVCRNVMWTIKDTAFADYPRKHIHYCSECGKAVKWE